MKKALKISMPLAFAFLVLSSGNLFAQFGGGGDPTLCGPECFKTAMEAAAACREAGGDFFECSKAFMEALSACRTEAGCDNPERPPVCGEECLTAARAAAKACREAGGDEAACFTEVKTQLRACLEAAGCELPVPPELPAPCGIGCLKDALGAARDCLQNGGKLGDCAVAFRDAFEACRTTANCGEGEAPSTDEDTEMLGLLLEETFVRGDVNKDGAVDVTDPVAILGYLFLGTTPPACKDSADANDDGLINIADPVFILSTLFLGKGSLPAPYPDEGFDPTEDVIVCGLPSN